MSAAGLLFITAPEVDKKTINRVLIHLRDYEFSDEGDRDDFHIVSTRDAEALKTAITNGEIRSTKPPVSDETNTTVWQNATLEEVEAFMLPIIKHFYEISTDSSPNNPFILDSQGLTEKTCIVIDRQLDENEDSSRPQDTFNKVRVPWKEVHSVWANLDISNMDFEDYCDEEQGANGEGWWRFNYESFPEEEDGFEEARTKDIEKMEERAEG